MRDIFYTGIVLSLVLFILPASSVASVIQSAEPVHVFENADVDYGMRAGVEGEVVKIIDNRSFVVQGTGLTKDEVLVLTTNKKGLSSEAIKALSSDNRIHVEGRAQVLSLEDLEDRTGVKLNDAKLKKFEGKTVVVAETVDLE